MRHSRPDRPKQILTVAGTTTSEASSVTVNTQSAEVYEDATFAKAGFSLSDGNNTFTAVGTDADGRQSTDEIEVNLPATVNYQYDSNGNLTNDNSKSFEYDDENQLVRVIKSTEWKSEFVYDAKMRRRVRKEFTWQNSAWVQTNEVRYVYDGNLVVQERNTNNLPMVSYTRGRDLSGSREGAGGIGGLLARTDHKTWTINSSQAHAYYHADANGNVTMLVNALQLIVAKYIYDPFGGILSKSGSLAEANLYRFSSKESILRAKSPAVAKSGSDRGRRRNSSIFACPK